MPGFHRQRHGFGHRGSPMQGAIWMIGLGFLMLTGDWWPGIMVLVGLSMIVGALTKETPQPFFDQPEQPETPPVSSVSPAPVPPLTPQPSQPATPVEISYRTDLLPSNCSQCGAPIRSQDVKWISSKSAACPYCGSTLSLKKS